jgi:uncharacterized coiled-coil protein SlyX
MTITEAIGIVIGILTILTAFWKAFRILDGLENKLLAQELTLNGTRERLEHLTSRFTARIDRLESRLNQFERFLAKTTEFEVKD